MHRMLVVIAIMLTAGSTLASEKTDVMAVVNQFIDGFNKDDAKTALAACGAPAFIIDEFPPYSWQGPTACADWANDFDANSTKDKITEPVVKLESALMSWFPRTTTSSNTGSPWLRPDPCSP